MLNFNCESPRKSDSHEEFYELDSESSSIASLGTEVHRVTRLNKASSYTTFFSDTDTCFSSSLSTDTHFSDTAEEGDDVASSVANHAKFIELCREHGMDVIRAQEPWPQDVKLFQPYEVEQIILPDNANCLAVQAYLKMCGLDFEVEPRHNAEYMSPSGRVPFIKCGAFVVSELDPIIGFINSKGISLSEKLDPTQKADMRAYMSLVNTVLANAELYVTWCDPTTLAEVTKPRYGSVYPWPLNHIVNWQKGGQVKKRLAVLGWYQKSLQEVYSEVENCCNALSERLEKKDYFFGDRPTELDAQVFGHLFGILSTRLPNINLALIVRRYETLMQLVKRIERDYFQRGGPDYIHPPC